jgi:hypothetical protein
VNCAYWRLVDVIGGFFRPCAQAQFYCREPFLGSISWLVWARDSNGVRNMTEQLIETPRDSFMEAAHREMIAFERKEREFRKWEKQERAEQLGMPALKKELNN